MRAVPVPSPAQSSRVPGAELEQRYQPSLNLHDFRWDHALFAGRKLLHDDFPADVTVLLIEAETTDFGVGLSPAVSGAADKVVRRVEGLIEDRLRSAGIPPAS